MNDFKKDIEDLMASETDFSVSFFRDRKVVLYSEQDKFVTMRYTKDGIFFSISTKGRVSYE